jgi:hypothetical protein
MSEKPDRICRTCNETKPLEEFGKSRTCKLGRKHECKACLNALGRLYKAERYKRDVEYRQRNTRKAIEWAKANPQKRAVIAKRARICVSAQ